MKRAGWLTIGLLVLVVLRTNGWAQPAPLGEKISYHLDTGWLKAPAGTEAQKVYESVIYVEGAYAMRLYFEEAHLSAGSWIEVRSLYDNEVQRLDPDQLVLWRNSTAFFNGNALLLMVYCAPESQARVVIRKIWIDRGHPNDGDFHPAEGCTQCGTSTCGLCSERRPACRRWTGECWEANGNCHQWSGRMSPIGCTASVVSRASCIISAGHCLHLTGDPLDYVIQFNVPASLPNCASQHPPVADQFPPVQQIYYYGSHDWAVIVPGPNSLGQLPYERYQQLRRPVPYDDVVEGQAVAVYGYGKWTRKGANEGCRNHTLQYDNGTVIAVFPEYVSANVEVDAGNSGSGLLRLSDQRLIGVVWTCGGSGTRTSYWEFVRARRMLCPTPGDVNEDGVVDDADLLLVLFAFGQECPLFCIEDQNDDGIVDDADLLIVLFHFGAEY